MITHLRRPYRSSSKNHLVVPYRFVTISSFFVSAS